MHQLTATGEPLRFDGIDGHRYLVCPEAALLFLAARLEPTPAAGRQLQAVLETPLHWPAIAEISRRHGVTGLVRRRVQEAGYWPRVPNDVQKDMDSWQRTRRRMHLTLRQQLTAIVEACSARGVDPIVLKGAATAHTLYPSPALRSMADLDVLVAPAEVSCVVDVLTRLGYRRQATYYNDEFNATHGYHLVFRDPDGKRLPVEVHWEIASRLERRNALSAAMLRDRTVLANVRTGVMTRLPMHILAPEARIVYLTTHMASEGHAFGRLIWLADLAAMIARPMPLSWPGVIQLARVTRTRAATYVALTLARSLLDADVPTEVLSTLRPPWLARRVVEHTLSPAAILQPLDAERRAIVKYLIVDTPAVTARLVWERIFPHPNVIRTYDRAPTTGGLAAAYARRMASIGTAALRKGRNWITR